MDEDNPNYLQPNCGSVKFILKNRKRILVARPRTIKGKNEDCKSSIVHELLDMKIPRYYTAYGYGFSKSLSNIWN